jgi:hypothetical protein
MDIEEQKEEVSQNKTFINGNANISITPIKRQPGAFDEEVPKTKYLFDLEKGWPILRDSFASLGLIYSEEDILTRWIKTIEEQSFSYKLHSLLTFQPAFNLEDLQKRLLKMSGPPLHVAMIPLLNHLFLIVNQNMEMMVFVLKYFALIAQKPNSKYGGTGLIFHSEDQGAGKSVFIKFMCLLFDPYTAETNDLEDLCGRFSTCMEEKVILHIEDPPGPQLSKFSEYLKGKITVDTTSIERKGRDAYRVANFCRFVLSTNYIEKLRLEPSDRRWTLIECSNAICNSCAKIAELEMLSSRLEENRMELEGTKVLDSDNRSPQDNEGEDATDLPSAEEIDFSDFKQVKGTYFKLLNIYFRQSSQLQRKFFSMLLHEVNIKNFHPEQNRPKSQLLLNCRSQALPPLQKFLMGLGNYFYLFPKKRKLFAEHGKENWVWKFESAP